MQIVLKCANMTPESQLKPYLSMVDEQPGPIEETKKDEEVFDFLF